MKYYLYLSLVILCFSPKVQAADLSVAWEVWPPYQYFNASNQLVGLDIDYLRAIMKEADLGYSTVELPWKAHLNFIKAGKIDVAMGASVNKEREQYAYFSIPYRHESIRLFVAKGQVKNIQLSSLTDLIGGSHTIGVESGYYYGEEYQALMARPEFHAHIRELRDLEQNVSYLLEGKIDGLFVDPLTMKNFVEKYKLQERFEQHPVKFYSANIHVMLSKKGSDEVILNKINQAIISLKKNGVLDAIDHKWSE